MAWSLVVQLMFPVQEWLPTYPWDELLAFGVLGSMALVPLMVKLGLANERRRLRSKRAAREKPEDSVDREDRARLIHHACVVAIAAAALATRANGRRRVGRA